MLALLRWAYLVSGSVRDAAANGKRQGTRTKQSEHKRRHFRLLSSSTSVTGYSALNICEHAVNISRVS